MEILSLKINRIIPYEKTLEKMTFQLIRLQKALSNLDLKYHLLLIKIMLL